MNWEAIGAIGEVAGAIAVVVTLVYLAIQIRQNSSFQEKNSQVAEANLNYAQLSSFSRMRQFSLDHWDLVVRGNRGNHLDESEFQIYNAVALEIIFTMAHNYLAAKAMSSNKQAQGIVRAMYELMAENPGLQRRWRQSEPFMMESGMDEFATSVNALLGDATHDP